MSTWAGCRAYRGQRGTTGAWLACEACGWPFFGHSPEAHLIHDDDLEPPPARGLLSDPSLPRPGVARAGYPTSAAAAAAATPRTGTQRRRILDWLAAHGPATDDEIQAALAMSGNTQRPRRGELEAGGWIEALEQLGVTASGHDAIRWRLTTAGRVALEGAA